MALHIYVRRLRGEGAPRTFVFNRTSEWVEERVVGPWRKGEEMVLAGGHWSPREVQVSIIETADEVPTHGRPLEIWSSIAGIATDRTDELLSQPAGRADGSVDPVEFAEDRRNVMVVNGRDQANSSAMFTFLRALDLRPMEWSELVGEASSGAPYIGDVLDAAFSKCQAVVVLSTPDDVAYLRPELVPQGDPDEELVPMGQARPNVFFEAGMALGRFPTRTILTEIGNLRPASDVAGRHTVRINSRPEWRADIAERLRNAGCEVNTSGTAWLSAGEFQEPSSVERTEQAGRSETRGLVDRIDAFIADLPSSGRATWTMGLTYNSLVEESGVDEIPRARQSPMSGLADMTPADMRMQLNQLKTLI